MAYKSISSNRQWFRAFVCLLIAISFLIVSVVITFIPILMAADYDAKVKRFNETGEELNKKAESSEGLTAIEIEKLEAQIDQHNKGLDAIEASEPPELGRLPALIAFPFFLGGLLQFFNFLRCLKSRSANELKLEDIGNDTRPPVLYLRPFTVDNAVLSSGARVFNPFNPFTYYKLKRTLFGGYGSFFKLRWTSEQVFEYVTRKLGPMVAIGQPNSPPVMGAYNLFVGEEWKERVQELAQRAQLVVLLAGDTTQGVMWEMSKATLWCDPEKFTLFVPGGRYRWWWPLWRIGSRRRNWAAFRKAYEHYCENAKPEDMPRQFPSPLPAKLKGAAFVGFKEDWSPVLLDPRSRPPVSKPRDFLVSQVMKII